MKALLNKCDDEYFALLAYRNTPLYKGYSPAQLRMGRKFTGRVPVHPDELLPFLREKQYRDNMTTGYNRRHDVVEGKHLSAGDRVWIPDLQTEGNVVCNLETPRSVLIDTPRSVVRRNRRMARLLELPTPVEAVEGPPIMTLPDDPVSIPKVGDFDYPSTVEHAAPAVSPRKSGRAIKKPARYVRVLNVSFLMNSLVIYVTLYHILRTFNLPQH